MFDSILVPLDGSPEAETALALATQIPCRTLHLLTVQPDCAEFDDLCRSSKKGSTYLEGIAESLRAQGRKVNTHVAVGEPGRQIAAFSAPTDLVVMGSGGHGAAETFLIGSVANWAAHHAPVPTLIVRGGERPAPVAPLTRIVVALDGSPLAEAALPVAERLARRLGLPIHLVRVLDFDPIRSAVQGGLAAAEAWSRSQDEVIHDADQYLADHARQLRDHGLTTTYELRKGLPTSELLNSVSKGDLVVMTTRERGGLTRWVLGSVADELMRRAPCPVLLVRDKPW